MNEMSKQQAEEITDLASYKAVTGARRFRRTKDEKGRGLSPEEALQERLALFRGEPKSEKRDESDQSSQPRRQAKSKGSRPSTSRKGDIVIRIRPQAGVDPEYFEKLSGRELEVVMKESWYGWVDTKLEVPYNGDDQRLMKHVLELGLGEVIVTINQEDDFDDHTLKFLDE